MAESLTIINPKRKLVMHQHVPVFENAGNENRLLKNGIWLYFMLIIFEGALRKWFLPGLATPLLVVRDPIALWLVISAYKKGLVKINTYVGTIGILGLIGIVTAIIWGHGNLFVAIYGARILLLHFPLAFVIGGVLNRQDVIRFGKATVWLSIPMTIIIALQFYSPQSAWINHSVGGLEGEGFQGGLGYFRPPGTFSFTLGTTLFYSFAATFIFFFWMDGHNVNKILLIVASCSLLAAIPFSISRALFFSVIISLIFMLIAIFRQPAYAGKMVLSLIGAIIIVVILSQTGFFKTGIAAFIDRFTSAGKAEGGIQGALVDRYLGGLAFALTGSAEAPALGYGLGMGTNVGSMMLTGRVKFLISEGEWGRVIGEMGPVMGLIIVIARIILSVELAIKSFQRLKLGDLLPWMLLSFGLLMIAQGNWAQPTSLGFFVMITGLLLAALAPETNIKTSPQLFAKKIFKFKPLVKM